MGVTGVLLGYPLPAGEGAPAPHASLGTKETDADAEASEAAHQLAKRSARNSGPLSSRIAWG
jgi:hypothetical protein